MTTTKPLPPTAQDPTILEAQQIKANFVPNAQAIRSRLDIDEVQSAQNVVDLWTASNERLAALYNDLTARRQARLDDIEKLVPLGPPVDPTASPADAAVLQQAFRAALTEARNAPVVSGARNDPSSNVRPLNSNASRGTLSGMLADAEAFDDDILRRAVLTAAMENDQRGIVDAYAEMHGFADQLEEFGDLQRALEGYGIEGQWTFIAFGLIPAPPEVDALPRLIAARQAARAASIAASAGYRNNNPYR